MTRVLALRALGLGDFLTGLPALRGLRRAFPGSHLMLAAPPALAPLVRLSRAADELVPAAPLEPLAVDAPDVAVNLHGRGPESHQVLLATRPRRLIGFEHPAVPESRGLPAWIAAEHEVDRWCRMLDQSGVVTVRTQLRLAAPPGPPVAAAAGALLIHPGAAAPARRWPAERWAEVAKAELAAGRRVAISCGPDERQLAFTVASLAGLEESSIVSGDLRELASAVGAASVIACGDTGVAHLATALGTPSVVLFGPLPPAEWGPPPWHPHVALWAGRRGDPHGDALDAGLLAITPQQVVAAAGRLRRRALD